MNGTQHLTALADPEELVDWRLAVCFEAAYSTGILEELPADAQQIAKRRDLDFAAVRAILHVLIAWGYVNVDQAGIFSEGPHHLDEKERAALAQHGTWVRRWAAAVPLRIKDRDAAVPGDPPRLDPAASLALLESASRPYIEPVVTACLKDTSAQRVLDLGGGHGAYALEFARRGCAVTMQDLPAVVDAARNEGRLERAGVELCAADAFTDIAPGSFDLILCGTLTNLFPLEQVRELLIRAQSRLAPGGRLAIATWMRDHGTVGAAFGVQMLVATRSGDAHGLGDYRDVLKEAGYSDVSFVEVGCPPLGVLLARAD